MEVVKKKKSYQKQEFDLVGEVIERKKRTVYSHNIKCIREINAEGTKWICDKESCRYGSECYILFIRCDNKPEVKEILCYEDKIKRYGTEKVWNAIVDKSYIDKRLLFVCHYYKRDYKLIDLREIPKRND